MAHPVIGRFGYIFLIVGPAIAIRAWARHRSMKRLQQRLRARLQHSSGEFAILFPPDTRGVAIAVRTHLEDITGLDLAGVTPDDHFTDDLLLPELFRQAMLELINQLEAQYDIVLPSESECLDMTLSQFIDCVEAAREADAES